MTNQFNSRSLVLVVKQAIQKSVKASKWPSVKQVPSRYDLVT